MKKFNIILAMMAIALTVCNEITAPKNFVMASGAIQIKAQVISMAMVMKRNDLLMTNWNFSLSLLPTCIEPSDWIVRQVPDRKRL